MKFEMFQINTDFLVTQLKNLSTQETYHTSFISKENKMRSTSQKILKTSYF